MMGKLVDHHEPARVVVADDEAAPGHDVVGEADGFEGRRRKTRGLPRESYERLAKRGSRAPRPVRFRGAAARQRGRIAGRRHLGLELGQFLSARTRRKSSFVGRVGRDAPSCVNRSSITYRVGRTAAERLGARQHVHRIADRSAALSGRRATPDRGIARSLRRQRHRSPAGGRCGRQRNRVWSEQKGETRTGTMEHSADCKAILAPDPFWCTIAKLP